MKRWQPWALGALALLLLGGRRRGMRVGVWYDELESWTVDHLDEALADMQALHFYDCSVELNRQKDEGYGLTRWSTDGIIWFSQHLRYIGIRPVLMYWPWPTRSNLDGLLYGSGGTPPLVEIARSCGAQIELDVEGYNWDHDRVEGFGSLDEATRYLMDELLRQAHRAGIEIQVTTHGGRVEQYLIAKMADVVAIQAYSHWKGGERPWDGPYGPGAMQRSRIELVRGLHHPGLIVGLAAWDQNYPGHTWDEAMQVALDACRAAGANHVRYWSAKHIFGHRAKTRSYEFIESIR